MNIFHCLLAIVLVATVQGFASVKRSSPKIIFSLSAESVDGEADPNDIVGRRIIVKGAVQGGYYRSCVNNEVSGNDRCVGYCFCTR
jgi:hypothetical protein